MSRASILSFVLAVAGASIAACAGAACTGPAASPDVAAPAGGLDLVLTPDAELPPGSVARVVVTIPEENKTAELALVGTRWEGAIDGVAAAAHTVHAEAYGPDGLSLFHDDVHLVAVRESQRTFVAIHIDGSIHTMIAPRVSTFVISPASGVTQGDVVNLTATATDNDVADRGLLTIGFTASTGTISDVVVDSASPTQTATAHWTAPLTTGTASLTARVTDPHGQFATNSKSVSIGVAKSSAQVTAIDFDQSPNILMMTTASNNVLPGGSTQLGATVSDPDGDPLTYAWTSSCGTFDNPALLAPVFTVAANASLNTNCLAVLTVSDGHGGVNNGHIGVTTGNGPVPGVPPVIDSTVQSAATVKPGETVVLRVHAHDPEGQALHFTVTSTAGSASGSQVAQGAADNELDVTWSAPCGIATSTITVNAINPAGQTTSAAFQVSSGATIVASGLGTGAAQVDQLAIAGTSLYFSTKSSNNIRTVPVAGGTVALRRSGEPVADLAADGTAVYWTNSTSNQLKKLLHTSSATTAPTVLFSGTSTRKPAQLVVQGGVLYLGLNATSSQVGSIATTGGTLTTLATLTGVTAIDALAVDGSTSFAATKATNAVARLGASGATFSVGAPVAEVTAGGYAFVAGSGGVSRLSESTTDNTSFNGSATGAGTHLATDAASVFAVVGQDIWRGAAGGTGLDTKLTCFTETVGEIVVDNAWVYAALPATGRIVKVAK